jgi:hypothetical protein
MKILNDSQLYIQRNDGSELIDSKKSNLLFIL